MARLILLMIRLYRRLTGHRPRSCRFYPSCSQYADSAVSQFGAVKGSVLTVKRLLKCHPFHPGGIDLVGDYNK